MKAAQNAFDIHVKLSTGEFNWAFSKEFADNLARTPKEFQHDFRSKLQSYFLYWIEFLCTQVQSADTAEGQWAMRVLSDDNLERAYRNSTRYTPLLDPAEEYRRLTWFHPSYGPAEWTFSEEFKNNLDAHSAEEQFQILSEIHTSLAYSLEMAVNISAQMEGWYDQFDELIQSCDFACDALTEAGIFPPGFIIQQVRITEESPMALYCDRIDLYLN